MMRTLLIILGMVGACAAVVTVPIQRGSAWNVGNGVRKMQATCTFTITSAQATGQWTIDINLNKPTSKLIVSI